MIGILVIEKSKIEKPPSNEDSTDEGSKVTFCERKIVEFLSMKPFLFLIGVGKQ